MERIYNQIPESKNKERIVSLNTSIMKEVIFCKHSLQMMVLLPILWGLCIADLWFTVWAHVYTPFYELNPIANHLLENNLGSLIAFKIGLTLFGSSIFWWLRKHKSSRIAVWTLMVIYSCLMLDWMHYVRVVTR